MDDADLTSVTAIVARRRLASALILLSLGVVVVAERDLAARPAEEIRGPKALWRVGCANAGTALVYLLWARRPAQST